MIQIKPEAIDLELRAVTGERLAELLKAKSWTLSEMIRLVILVAPKELRPTDTLVRGWLKGVSEPSNRYLPVLAAVFGVSIEELYGVLPAGNGAGERTPS
jgi:transcriptional regulator with XRE-family HTH domain